MRLLRPLITTSAALALISAAAAPMAAAASLDITPTVTVSQESAATWDKFQVNVFMNVPDSAQPGDTFTLALGEGLIMYTGAVDLMANGEKVATVVQSGGVLTYTFTDYVATHDNVTTTLNFWAKFEESTVTGGETVDVNLVVNGKLVPTGKQIQVKPQSPTVVNPYKWMAQKDPSQPVATWGIVLPAASEDLLSVTITDIPGDGLDLICPLDGRLTVYQGPDREAFNAANLLAASQYNVDCNADRLIVTLNQKVPAGNALEVRGNVSVTEARDVYYNTATIGGSNVKPTELTTHMRTYGSGGEGTGDKGSVTVGDYVWLDTDKDGIQDEGEKGIPGVTLVLTGPDGGPVTDVKGNPVGPQVTDENGLYLFPNLPILKEGESYTVTIDKDASAEALKGLKPTKTGKGDRATDSSTDFASSEGLTVKGQKDLTLDFGFIKEEPYNPPYVPPTDDEEDEKPKEPGGEKPGDEEKDKPNEPGEEKPKDEEGEKPVTPPVTPPTTPPTTQPKNPPAAPKAQQPKLARTGIEAAGLIAAAGAAMMSGTGMLAWRRRRDK